MAKTAEHRCSVEITTLSFSLVPPRDGHETEKLETEMRLRRDIKISRRDRDETFVALEM